MEHTPPPYEVAPPPGPERRRKVLSLEWLKKWRKSRESGESVVPPEQGEKPKKMARKVLEALGIRRRQNDATGDRVEGSIGPETDTRGFLNKLRERGRSLLRLAERVEHSVVERAPIASRAAAIEEVAPVTAAAEKLGEALEELDEAVEDDRARTEPAWNAETMRGSAPAVAEYGGPDALVEFGRGAELKVPSATVPIAAAVVGAASVPFVAHSLEGRYQDLKDKQKTNARRIRVQEKIIASQDRAINRLEEQQVNYVNRQERANYIEKVAEITAKQAEVTHEVATGLRSQQRSEFVVPRQPDEVFHIPRPTSAERVPQQQKAQVETITPSQSGEQAEIPLQRSAETTQQEAEKQPEVAEPIIAPEVDDGRIERNIYTHDNQATDGGARMGGAALRTTVTDTPQTPAKDNSGQISSGQQTYHVHRQVQMSASQRWLYGAAIATAALAIIGAVLSIL